MKRIKWVNGNKMAIDTGHRTFDSQTNIISTGNLIANTVLGAHIRPYNETRIMNGEHREPGYLQRWDLENFSNLPLHVRLIVQAYGADNGTYLYRFHHFNNRKKIIHGYILTSDDHRFLYRSVTGPTYKSWDIMREVQQYVTRVTSEPKDIPAGTVIKSSDKAAQIFYMLATLRKYDKEAAYRLEDHHDIGAVEDYEWPWWVEDHKGDTYYLFDELVAVMGDMAPAGYRFGEQEKGDNNYGYWPK